MPGEIAESTPTSTTALHLSNDNENTISSPQKLNTIGSESFKLYLEYHESEIKQNQKIYNLARGIIWVGFGVMMIGVIACFFGQVTPAILTATTGALTELISGTILVFLSQSSKSKQDYYKQLSFDEEFNKYISVIHESNLSEENKVALLGKLIENYSKRRK